MRVALTVATGLLAALAVVALAAGSVCLTAGCSSIGYYGQAVSGHLALMRQARPVTEVEADPATPALLRQRLLLSQRIRDYAVVELKLPDNSSYRRYVALGRTAAVWNVVAAPALSLTLKTWCFPVMGCVGYRGYYDRAPADQLAAQLQGEGLEVRVYGVPAYSTLGLTEWMGGDPLLSTFIRWPEGELARLIFHELSHQVAYAADDTTFNESFAVAVERIGGERWLATQAGEAARAEYAVFDRRRQDFRDFTLQWRQRLDALYGSPWPDDQKQQQKAALLAEMRADYERAKATRWGGYAGYDAWFASANNAAFGVQAAYDELVPEFERLFQRSGGDFQRFYKEVKALAALPKAQRRAKLADPG